MSGIGESPFAEDLMNWGISSCDDQQNLPGPFPASPMSYPSGHDSRSLFHDAQQPLLEAPNGVSLGTSDGISRGTSDGTSRGISNGMPNRGSRGSPRCRPTSSSPVHVDRPSLEGYGPLPSLLRVDANAQPFEQKAGSLRCSANHEGLAIGFHGNLNSWTGSHSAPLCQASPASSYSFKRPPNLSSPEQQFPTQSEKPCRPPQFCQIAWNSKTGELVMPVQPKRKQSEEDKALRKEVRRLGGSCEACRHGHRKVI